MLLIKAYNFAPSPQVFCIISYVLSKKMAPSGNTFFPITHPQTIHDEESFPSWEKGHNDNDDDDDDDADSI